MDINEDFHAFCAPKWLGESPTAESTREEILANEQLSILFLYACTY